MRKLLISASAIALFACSTPAKKYTYQIKFFSDTIGTESNFNSVGLEGWQLVSARRANFGSDTIPDVGYECIFMREER